MDIFMETSVVLNNEDSNGGSNFTSKFARVKQLLLKQRKDLKNASNLIDLLVIINHSQTKIVAYLMKINY